MELMEGGELFDYVVQKGTLTEDEAAKIVRSVTDALVYMHSKNIMHRDLKPENLLLRAVPKSANDTIEVKIIDFGLSKAVEEDLARSFLGTRGYLAPEMLQRRDYTRAVDTWALGVIVFVLLCGCLPFDDDSQTVPSDDLVRKKFVLRFPRWAKNLSASAKDLLSHLLDVDPMSRYTAEQALNHPWVRGETAPKNNMLASPGRIKKSPVLRARAGRTPTQPSSSVRKNDGRYHPPNRGPHGGAASTPPQRVIVRKQSI
jgi:serine/threonine protein kinase